MDHQPALKLQTKRDAFLHLPELLGVVDPTLRRNFRWVFFHQPTGRVHAVDAQIHQRAAPGYFRIDKPGRGNARRVKLTERGVYNINATEFATLSMPLQSESAGLVTLPVAGHQQHTTVAAAFDHGCGLLNSCRQWLLAQNVSTRLSRLDR